MGILAVVVETFVLAGAAMVLVAAAANLGLIGVVYKMAGRVGAITMTATSAALWMLAIYS